jgi:hypothetical protein
MRFKMTETKIIIPKKVKYTKVLTCIFHPPTDKAQISFTLNGENKPFRIGKLSGRCKEISAFMFRPESLDEEYSKPLKAGDIIDVEVIVNGAKKDQKVEIT